MPTRVVKTPESVSTMCLNLWAIQQGYAQARLVAVVALHRAAHLRVPGLACPTLFQPLVHGGWASKLRLLAHVSTAILRGPGVEAAQDMLLH